MMLFLHGEDTFRSRRRLKQLVDAFRKKFDEGGTNVTRLGPDADADAVNRALFMQGFFAAKRCIVLDGVVTGGKPDVLALLAEAVAGDKVSDDHIVLFWEAGAPAVKGKKKNDTALWNALAARAKEEVFEPLAPAAVEVWLVKEARARGGVIEPAAARLLASIAGSDLWRADAELEKLLHFTDGAPVTEAHVGQMLTVPMEENIFRFIDAVGARKTGEALRMLEEQFQLGVEPLAIVRTLSWHLRNMLAAASLLADGAGSSRQLASDFRMHPFVAQKTMQQAKAMPLDHARDSYFALLELDRVMKTRPVDGKAELTLFTLRMLSSGRRSASQGATSFAPRSSSS